MSVSDPVSTQTRQPSLQPKRTFPWDYTISGRKPTSVPELKGYTPRKPEDVSGNGYSNERTKKRIKGPREVRFSLDNPAFDEKEKPYIRDQGYGRPVPSNDAELGLDKKYTPSSTGERKDIEKHEKKKNNYKYCVLIIIVLILLLLLLTMTGLFIWRMFCCSSKDVELFPTPTVSG